MSRGVSPPSFYSDRAAGWVNDAGEGSRGAAGGEIMFHLPLVADGTYSKVGFLLREPWRD